MTILVYLDQRDGQRAADAGHDWFAPYVQEVLAHAGIGFAVTDRAGLSAALAQHRLLILPYDAPLDDAAREAITRFAERHAVLGIGGTSGVDALFGVRQQGALGEGYGQVTHHDAITRGVTSSLHCWGGVAVSASAGTATSIQWQAADGGPTSPLLCRLPRAILIASDLPGTLVRIQQGIRIEHDGEPAPDGTAAIDDGILKTDDGMTLDWTHDRAEVAGQPCFLEPVGDDWRDLLIRCVLSLCTELREPLPLLWYWPDDVPAVGLLSHDTDGNVEELGWQELEAVEGSDIKSSWCFIRYPETYSQRLYQTVVEHGHEACLHYDAHSQWNQDDTFSEARFLDQLQWLRSVLPNTPIISNKNHYLRWEGWTEAWRWMEAAGITVDQCKGPSKRGNCGFIFGGAHPWFPIEDAAHGSRFLDVLEINLFAQDQIVAAPPELAEPLIDRTRARGGVAHFLFHPAHVAKPGVADSMAHTIAYAKYQGMQWWTSDRIGNWERARRRARLAVRNGALHMDSSADLSGATVLLLDVSDGTAQRAEGWERVERWGYPFWRHVGALSAAVPGAR